ncbi:MAG: hypothetical protein AAF437_02955 [Pseudomonadota bacterium]
MRKFQWAWTALLVIVFFAFSAWYGGNGKPISAEDGAAMLEQLRANYADDGQSDQNFIVNMERMIPNDDGKEFYAVNLEQLKDGAEAEAADAAYARTVFPLLLKRGGHPVFVSHPAGLMLGDYGDQVDRVVVVRYRSLRDLIDMANDPAMIAGSPYKFQSLDHTEVFITRPRLTFVHVRFTMALLLSLIGIIGWWLIAWASTRLNARNTPD